MNKLIFFLLIAILNFAEGQTWQKQFGGFITVGKKSLPIEMKLTLQNDSINGNYYYENMSAVFTLSGTLVGNKLKLTEKINGKETGTFSGTCFMKGDSIKGVWTRKRDKSNFTFFLRGEEWLNYRLIQYTIGREDDDFHDWQGFEMRDYADTIVQKKFNELEENVRPAPYVEEKSSEKENPDEIEYSLAEQQDLNLKTNYFISFNAFHSNYFGGAGADNSIRNYHFNLKEGRVLEIRELLREDTLSEDILWKWICAEIKTRGDWDYFEDDYLKDYKDGEIFFEDFYFTNEGVYFFFPRPGAFTNILGLQDVKISLKKMAKLLKKDSDEYKWVMEKLQKKFRP